jgi:glutathione S-transferase
MSTAERSPEAAPTKVWIRSIVQDCCPGRDSHHVRRTIVRDHLQTILRRRRSAYHTGNCMILYYTPGACSLADHITLIETGLPHKLVRVSSDKRTDDGRDFNAINPKGYVPVLELDDGTLLTENPVVLAYIAEAARALFPKDSLDRWRVLEALAFMATEVHGTFKPFFFDDSTAAEKNKARQILEGHFGRLAEQLDDKSHLISDRMTIADPYLFVMLRWASHFGIKVSDRLVVYRDRLKRLPSFAQALIEEGLD